MADSREPMVSVDAGSGVATVTLNRPDRNNGLDVQLKTELRDALASVAADGAVRAVLLTGAGRSFCVGQDLVEHAAALDADAGHSLDTVAEHYNPIVESLLTMPKPVVAAVNGLCVGAGLGFALACDLRVAADSARFGTAFTGIGLTCDSGLSATLARAVGASRASELVLLGEMFDATGAAGWGIVNRVVAAADLLTEAGELARRLAAGPTAAYAEVKQALAGAWSPGLTEVLAAEAAGQARMGLTADHQGAVRAFLAKEKPTFTGR